MRSPLMAALAAGILLCTASSAAAQTAAVHQGFWLGAGLGVGSARLSCSICQGNRGGGTSGYLRAGFTITRQMLVGLEGNAWYRSQDNVDHSLNSLQAVFLFYPGARSGLYVKTGLGLAKYTAKDGEDRVSSQALAGSVGLGYELRLARTFSIVPYANFMGSAGADVRLNDSIAGLAANTSLLQFGLGLTLH